MDRERFDALTKMFATKGSRRAAFAGFLSAAVLGGGAEALAKSGKGKHRGQHNIADKSGDPRHQRQPADRQNPINHR